MAKNTTEPRRPNRRSGADDELPVQNEPVLRQEPAIGRRNDPAMRSRPANENDPTTAQMVANMRRSPSFLPFYAAFVVSLAWVFAWFFGFGGNILATASPFSPQSIQQTMLVLALLFVPIMAVWAVAYLMWRAAQLRQTSEVLMQSAMKLVRPHDIATEGLATIAQAVRSEVDLLVGGVEHAVQRAGELESIVHKEIAAIERAFGGNEERIRGLVVGLENQRNALQQAGMVIGAEASPLLARLESNTASLDSIIGNAQSTLIQLEHGLKSHTVELARTIDQVASRAAVAGDEIGGQTAQMERMSGMLVNELRAFSGHLTQQIDTLNSAATSLNAESSNFGKNVTGMEYNIVQLLKSSIGELSDRKSVV